MKVHVQGKGSTADQGSSNYTQCFSSFFLTSLGTRPALLFKRFPSSATETKAVRPNHEVSHRYSAHAQPIQKGER